MNGVEKIRKNVKVSKRDGKNGQAALHSLRALNSGFSVCFIIRFLNSNSFK